MARNNSLNILPWYDSLEKQNHRLWWAYDRVFPLATELDKIPPFQIVRSPQTGAAITEFKLIRFEDNVETDILLNAQSTGLEVATFDDYDLLIYPSTLSLGLAGVEIGAYYLKLSDGTNTWYSEVFTMCDDLSDYIKIEYWHGENLVYPGGHIRYQFPYKNRVYICSDIGRPSYEYEERVVKREGYNFPVQQISYKQYKFLMLAPEYLIDAFRVIRMHDQVEIFYGGYTFDVDELLMNDPRWQSQGWVAEVEVEFRTDTVVVVNGRGVNSTVYELLPGQCLAVDFMTVALIDEGSAEYTGFYYEPSGGGANVNFADGDLVLIRNTSGEIELFLFQESPDQYVSQSVSNYQVSYNANDDDYYFVRPGGIEFIPPEVTSVENQMGVWIVNGHSFPGTIVEVYTRDSSNNETKVGEGSADTFNSEGLEFTFLIGAEDIQVRSTSVACSQFASSLWFELPVGGGIGTGMIGNTFIVG